MLRRIAKKVAIFAGLTIVAVTIFLAVRPEGKFMPADPTATIEPASVRVLTWNVLRGSDEKQLGVSWEERRAAYQKALASDQQIYDLLCFQEALPNQIEFFKELLPDHDWYGVGRDDGASSGEHCPIFFSRSRFIPRDRGTFWLSPTPEQPSCGWGEIYPRICTWLELEDRVGGGGFRVYNVHLQLHPLGQVSAAELLAERIAESDVPVLLVGDMNCPPDWPALRRIESIGLRDAETSGALTYQTFGKGIRCLDHIFVCDSWLVPEGGIIREQYNGVSPSDHFGLWSTCVPKGW
jgi:endonuclease/exonuclease/phosphatase family metal-dependent hydrolase